MPVRLAAKQVRKIDKLAELEGVDRSTVMRQLIDIGLASPQVTLLMRRPGTKGRGAVGRVIRVVAAHERVKVTQSAVMRAPSVETEVNALRAEEELDEAMAAYEHHHLKPPDLCRPDRFDFLDGAADMSGLDGDRDHAVAPPLTSSDCIALNWGARIKCPVDARSFSRAGDVATTAFPTASDRT